MIAFKNTMSPKINYHSIATILLENTKQLKLINFFSQIAFIINENFMIVEICEELELR